MEDFFDPPSPGLQRVKLDEERKGTTGRKPLAFHPILYYGEAYV
ncbi:MAG TPA: hypothetical protein VMW10_12865 [Alphaproteobacteria bacterium]|nr:hypothetical protein [Alphaproteobacteria bacterium]